MKDFDFDFDFYEGFLSVCTTNGDINFLIEVFLTFLQIKMLKLLKDTAVDLSSMNAFRIVC